MIYIEAPNDEYLGNIFDSSYKWSGKKSVFLAGGIMMCPPWQEEMVELLRNETDLILLNPRRKSFPMDDPSESERQIKWEHQHLELANAILFWFSPPTQNPIVFYELGRWIATNKQIFIGIHPDFERTTDVLIQTKLERPNMNFAGSLEELAAQVCSRFA